MLNALKKEFELHSMKLAGFAAAFTSWIIFNQELLFTLLSLVPIADVPRGITALAVGLIVYFGPRIARYWPQPNVALADDEEEAGNVDQA